MKKTKLLLSLLAIMAFGQMAWAQSIVSVNYVDENGVTQPVNATSLDEIAGVNPNGATIGTSGFTNWYVVQGSNVVMNGQLGYYGGINLILCDGAKLTVNNTGGNAIQSLDDSDAKYTLTIYVQTNGTGQLVATASGDKAIQTENLTIHGGVIRATGGAHGIHAPANDIIINGGNVTAVADGNAIEGYNITINGGIVSATGNGGIKNGMTGVTTLGYTNNTDRITATNYLLGYTAAQVRVKDGQYLITDNGVIVYGWLNENKRDAIAGHTLSPYIPTEWSGSGDSANDPYIIASVDDLNLLSLRTNGSDNTYSGKYFKLGANITYTPSTTWNDASSTEHNFTAINGFDGHFDGDSHTISGLRIYANDNEEIQNGLFTNLGPNAYIEKLTISNARITGEKQIGAIAGYVNSGATVTNCHVTGNVAVHAKGHTLENHGGIVGINYGTISNCVSEATISRGNYAYGSENVGGITGYNEGTLSGNKVFNVNITAGSHYGAIAGLNNGGTLTNNYYHACTVNGTANTVNIGVNGADITTGDGAMSIHTITKPNDVTNSTDPTLVYGGTNYWMHGTTITLNGGLGGTPTAGWQKAYCVNDVAISENSTTISHDFDMPAEDVTITIGEIHADWAIANVGTQADPYKIYFTDQLDLLATRVNNGTTYEGYYFQLMNNLEYDNTASNNYIAIGTSSHPFKGHFNGNQKTIDGIRINTTGGYLGVFGLIENAEVQNLYVDDIEITAHDHVGCIVGECNGSTVTGCRVSTATLTNIGGGYSDCPWFGGIAGHHMGTSTMSNNFVLGVDIPQVYHFGAIAGDVGYDQGLVSNYYHNCSVSGTAHPTGIGRNGGDVTTNDGARPVFTVSVPDGVTASATATVTYNTVKYYKEGITITLSGGLDGSNPNPGFQNAYVVYGETLMGSNLDPGHEFNMQSANAVVTIGSMPADWAAEQGAGDTEENPYKIYNKEQFNVLASRVNAGNNYSGKYFKLMDDLTYNYTGTSNENNYTAIGTNSNPFKGHFNGNHKTVNGIRIYSTGEYLGVFGYIVDAEVKDLYVNNIVITGHGRAGSIVGECDGSTAITGCQVTTATLTATEAFPNSPWFGGIAGRKSGTTSTMNNNFVLGLTIPQAYHFGAIAGENSTSDQSMVSNYYHDCTVGSTAYPTGIGCNGQDVEGAKPVFTLSVATGITANATVTLTYNEVNYYKLGNTVTLSYTTPANPGYEHIYSVNGTPIEGNIFTMNGDANVTIAPNQLIDWETAYSGEENNPYLISNVQQWNQLASRVNGGNTYSGKFFKLTENISVTNMVGGGDGSTNVFSGTFDGDGHTITFNVNNTSEQYTAPFRRIDGATVKGIRLNGNVTSSNRFAGGIVAYAKGTSTVINCVNSTGITSYGTNENASNGGIVGMVGGNGTINITGCVFNGEMTGVTNSNNTWSGILGLCNDNSTANISDCFIDPVSSVTGGNTIYRNSGTTNCSNCYYTKTIGTAQGLKARSISGGTDVTVSFAGDANEYSASNITAYTNGNANLIGLKYGNTLYAGKNETVSVNLEYAGNVPAHHAPAYTASNATVSGTENPYTLNMGSSADAAVVISCENTIVVWEGHGTETDPYLIYTNEQWDLLAEKVNTGNQTYNGEYFKLMADITISYTIDDNYPDYLPKLVGYDEDHSFRGTFDGNNHKITLDYYDQTYLNVCAPFRFVKNATIKRLTVEGEIQKEYKKNVASIVGDSYGTTNLISCYSEAGVYNHKGNHTNDPDERDGTSGGLVGRVSGGTINLTNCSYNGKLAGTSGTVHGGSNTYTTKWGGLVAYVGEDCTANLINCFCEIRVELWDTDGSEYFVRKHSDATVNLINCYRSDKLQYPNVGDTRKVFPNSDQGIDATNMTDEELHNALGYAWMVYASTYHDHHVHPVTAPQTFTGQGTEGSPYQIATAADWDKFAIYVAHKDNHSSDYFQMTNDISTTSMVGLFDDFAFQGSFDGAGNTLNVNYNVTVMPDNKSFSIAAPFAYINNAAIQGLHVTGSIATVSMRPAGVAGFVVGNSSITNCKSEVAISSSYNNDIDAGGIVARVNESKTLTLTGCAFTGSITYSEDTGYEGGGMVGYTQTGATATLTDCLFAPSAISIIKYNTSGDDWKKHWMFVGGKVRGTYTNCYYNDVAAATSMVAENKLRHSITSSNTYIVIENVTAPGTEYNVSGITSYSTGINGYGGIKYSGALYAGNEDILLLSLDYTEPGYTVSAYYANGELLSETLGNYQINMPDANVVITATTTVAEWEGTGEDWDHAYLIYNKEQLNTLASRVNGGNDYSGKYFKVMNNITYTYTNASNNTNYTAIGNSNSHKFNGHFDGQNYTIRGVRDKSGDETDIRVKGLFGYLGSGAEVKNIVLSDVQFYLGRPMGGIAGNNEGTITNCHVTSNVEFRGTLNSSYIMGGIVGTNQSTGTITHCSFAGTLNRNHRDWSSNNYEYGGIVGGNNGTVTDNFVNGATIYQVPTNYSQGGQRYMTGYGAIFGHQHTGTIARNYYTNVTTVTTEPDGNSSFIKNENVTGIGSGGYTSTLDLNNVDNYPDGAVPGNTRTITGYGESETTGWAFIASPVVQDMSPGAVTNLLGTGTAGNYDYDLFRFNPTATTNQWENYLAHTTGFVIANGTGYLYANQSGTTLQFIGTTYNTATSQEVVLEEGWNLVGNPFPRAAWISKPYYMLNSDGSAVLTTSESIATPISPCYGVVVEGTENEEVTFSTTAPGQQSANNNGNLQIALAQTVVTRGNAGNKTIDNAIVSFNEGSQLGKFYFGSQSANIYLPKDDKDYAIAFSDKRGEVPVCFKAAENGTFTLTVSPEGVQMAYLHLIDNMTGADIDLLTTPSYTFTGRTSDYTSRFKLAFVANDAQIGGEGSDDFAFINNGELIVLGEGTLQVFDVLGHQLFAKQVSTPHSSLLTSNFPAGVYLLRLITSDRERVQKIVVK